MSLSQSLKHHFCLSMEAQRSPLRDAQVLRTFRTTGAVPLFSE